MRLILPGAAGLLSGLLIAALLPLSRRLGFLDVPDDRKDHSTPTPLIGGPPLLLAGWALPALAGWGAPILVHCGLMATLILGALDDFGSKGLGWKPKLAGQFIAGLLAGAGLFPGEALAWVGFSMLAVLLQNALNFQDNMNGLAAGTGLLLFLLLSGEGPIWACVAASCLSGALVPLLLLNFPKARLFLGDQGSLLLGLSLALLVTAPESGAVWPARPALVFLPAVPVLDLTATILYRYRKGLPLTRADNNHLSHRLVRLGLTRTAAVGVLWAAAVLLGVVLPRAAEILTSLGGAQ